MIYKLGQKLTLSDVQVLFKSAKTKSYASGEHLIIEGETNRNVFFIRKGLVRAYKINEKGDEITTLIRWENKIIASPDIILFDEPSQLYVETLEHTDVFYIDYDVLQKIISSNHKLESNRKFILQNVLKEALKRIDSFVLLTPVERYLAFIKENPDIVNRVQDKYIANILGITPVSLSRIRKRIITKKK
ncbi:MAG: Crp/Fnr family transcriptional regulator [Winogradskyella sp.]|nr:Crp/Fnr family transcriptional regulator [Winogradskyella sp.]